MRVRPREKFRRGGIINHQEESDGKGKNKRLYLSVIPGQNRSQPGQYQPEADGQIPADLYNLHSGYLQM